MSANALTDCIVWVAPSPQAQELFLRHAELRWGMLRSAGDRLAQVENLLEEVAFERLPERLAWLLLDLACGGRFITAISHNSLANMLGTYRETVSVILRGFKAAGLVELVPQDRVVRRRRLASGSRQPVKLPGAQDSLMKACPCRAVFWRCTMMAGTRCRSHCGAVGFRMTGHSRACTGLLRCAGKPGILSLTFQAQEKTMPSQTYLLDPDNPQRLEIAWGLGAGASVSLDGQNVGTVPGRRELLAGQTFRLPDGSVLKLRLIQRLTGSELHILRDGQPIPGPPRTHRLR